MRALIRFLINYHVFILFLALETVSFMLLVNNNYYQKATFVSFAEKLSGSYYEKLNAWTNYFDLRDVNARLAEENNLLKNKLQAFTDSDDAFYFGVTDTIYSQHYYYLGAKVINNSVNKQHNFITLNKGAELGIKPEMGVISDKGVVGVVTKVSKSFATVISVLNTNLNISAKIKKNGYYGSLSWDGADYERVVLTEIPYHVDVQKGDTIITSGYSTIFPEGVLIGTIEEYEVEDGNFHTIKVKLANDFKHLDFVNVVSNLKKNEQLNLEGNND